VGGLDGYIAAELGMEVTAVNPLQAIGFQDPANAPQPADGAPFALGLGLGMRRVRWL
jgi:Tfp pilus assembly PilM family ATPase